MLLRRAKEKKMKRHETPPGCYNHPRRGTSGSFTINMGCGFRQISFDSAPYHQRETKPATVDYRPTKGWSNGSPTDTGPKLLFRPPFGVLPKSLRLPTFPRRKERKIFYHYGTVDLSILYICTDFSTELVNYVFWLNETVQFYNFGIRNNLTLIFFF